MAEMFQYERREPLTDRLSYFTRHAGLDPASYLTKVLLFYIFCKYRKLLLTFDIFF